MSLLSVGAGDYKALYWSVMNTAIAHATINMDIFQALNDWVSAVDSVDHGTKQKREPLNSLHVLSLSLLSHWHI